MTDKILIVDDEHSNRYVLEEILSMYSISSTSNAQEMWKALEKDNFDLILLDIMLPDEDGFKIMEKLRINNDYNNIPVIFITAKNNEEDVRKGFALGGADYIKKPFFEKELLARIEIVMARRQSDKKLQKQRLIIDSYIDLFTDIIELNKNLYNIPGLDMLFKRIVDIIYRNIITDVCSLYLFNSVKNELILRATLGLNSNSVGNFKLKLGEGIVGYSLKEMKSMVEKDGTKSPYFKKATCLGEEAYKSYLVVPILHDTLRIGVLVLQKTKREAFKDRDLEILETVASQLSTTIENAKFIFKLTGRKTKYKKHKDISKGAVFKGKSIGEGVAVGKSLVLDRERTCVSLQQKKFNQIYTLKDFKRALKETQNYLRKIQRQVEREISEEVSGIFAAQLLILKDKTFIGAITELILKGENAPTAILNVGKKYIDIFSKTSNTYIQEKQNDIEDLMISLIANLTQEFNDKRKLVGSILIAKDLFPSDIPKFFSSKVAGIVLTKGTITAHISILARSLEIPFIVLDIPNLEFKDGMNLLLDGSSGSVYFNPKEKTLNLFEKRKEKQLVKKIPKKQKTLTTKCGSRIKIMSNVNFLRDIKLARECNVDGIGLYRSEVPFLIRSNFLTEDEQIRIYKELIKKMENKEIIFRTLDIGGDKFFSSYHFEEEKNPFLGLRSIRFCLKNKNIFMTQIRAILRAGYNANIKIMFPMISSKEEFIEARKVVLKCIKDLEKKGVKFNSDPQIGMMIELPSAIEIIDELARYADFFSIGTNDLVQYMLAVDRTNEKVSSFYQPEHPSVLRVLKKIVDAALKENIAVSICGDMAHNKKYIKFLLGIGLKNFSVDSIYIPRVKNWISKIELNDAQNTAEHMLNLTSKKKIMELLV